MEQYNPHPETTIDEDMIGYSGILGFVQYLPLKPIKRGIKVWMRADPHNGYVNDFNFYTVKDRAGPQKGLAERVVKDLVQPIYGLNHIVYMDNFSVVFLSTHTFFHKAHMHVEHSAEEDPESQMRCQRLN